MAKTELYTKLNPFKKVIFYFGFLGILNLLFWILICICFVRNKKKSVEERKEGYALIIYIFGWFYFIFLLYLLIANFFYYNQEMAGFVFGLAIVLTTIYFLMRKKRYKK